MDRDQDRSLTFRPLTADDVSLIVRHREAMFAEGGRYPVTVLAEMSAAFAPWLVPRLQDGRYLGFGIECDGHLEASVGMMVLDWPPHPLHLAPGRAYLLNLYVSRTHRRQGLARALVDHCFREADRRGLQAMVLHPTAEAAGMYQGLGFRNSGELIRITGAG